MDIKRKYTNEVEPLLLGLVDYSEEADMNYETISILEAMRGYQKGKMGVLIEEK